MTAVSNIAITASSPTSAMKGDMIGAQLLLLMLLEGPEVSQAEIVLRSSVDLTSPFPVGNPFKSWAADSDCEVTDALARNDVECNIFSNYGEDVIVLFSILALNVII